MPFSWLGVIIASTCLIGILYGSIIGKTKFDVKDITFRSPNIPQSFNGYKIIQLSDIHIGSWTNNEKELERFLKESGCLAYALSEKRDRKKTDLSE